MACFVISCKKYHLRACWGLLCSVFLNASSIAQTAPSAALTPPLQDWLKQAGIPVGSVGLMVSLADGTDKPLLSLNPQQALNPASVMKLYTTYGALELLGAPYTWKTQIVTSAKLQGATLQGDVVVKGSGDPSLKLQDVWRLLRELRLAGVKHIAGDWVLDRRAFAEEPTDTSQFDGEGARPYNVQPDGLLMSLNASRFIFRPNDAAWHISVDPLPLGWTVQGSVAMVGSTPCGDWRSKLSISFKSNVNHEGGSVLLAGSIPKSCGQQALYRAIAPAQAYGAGLIKALWAELGGTHTGGFKSGTAAPDATVFAEVESEPLSTIIRDINKRSNNVMARMLYLNLARAPQASRALAEQRLRAWLVSAGLNDASVVFDNGSGLSRDERASAMALLKLLQFAYAGPMMAEFMSSLAVVAQDGTVARRMGPAAGSAHLKTGTLKDSAALAGYVLGASGKRYALAGIVNHIHTVAARAVLDKVVLWVQQNG